MRVCEAGRAEFLRPGFRRCRAGRGVMNRVLKNSCLMSASDQTSGAGAPGNWLVNQPYLLLVITSMCWAGNAIAGRMAAGHIPPVTLAFLRWSLAFLTLLPFAWKHLRRDRAIIRRHLGTMIVLSITGISAFNVLQYWALAYTTALNTLLLQSAAPLFVGIWSLLLFGVRLTLAQVGGIAVSLIGVLVILLQGDLTALAGIAFNKGDLIFTVALAIFGLYPVLSRKRPQIHHLSFISFIFGCGAACLLPLLVFELSTQPIMQINAPNLLVLIYVAIFPSTVAYLCYNRGVQLIGANRSAPFFHVVPVFGTLMSILFLGEHPQAFHFIAFALVMTGVYVASRKPATPGVTDSGNSAIS